MNEFKITKTNNRNDRRSVRWTHDRRRRGGWETVWQLALLTKTSTENFVKKFSPGVYADHVEFSADDWLGVCSGWYGKSSGPVMAQVQRMLVG